MSALPTFLVLAVYAAIAFSAELLGFAPVTLVAASLTAVVILLAASHVAVTLAGTALVFMMPVCALSAFAAHWVVDALPKMGGFTALLAIPIAAVTGWLAFAVFSRLTSSWRGAASGGLSLIFGAGLLIMLAPLMRHAKPVNGWYDMAPALIALLIALVLLGLLARSAVMKAITVTRTHPDWSAQLGLPAAKIRRQLLDMAGLLSGLAAVPFWASHWPQDQADWPGLWFGTAVTAVLASRLSFADALYIGLPTVILPFLAGLFFPALPNLMLPAAITALLVSSLIHRGLRPGEEAGGRAGEPLP